MAAADRYEFRRVVPGDLAQLARWQARPHVRAWWDDDDPGDAEDLKDPRVVQWIVSTAGRPFAFMQDYTVHGWDNHHFFHLPTGARGIDQFIGEEDMTGKGHGPGFIAQRVRRLFAEGAPVVATDPHPENARAISAYRKAGFVEAGPAQETPWGLILPMTIRRESGSVL